ncbi:hypothetical protein FBEOM_8816 [Fusarium beomiforme]|uniref:BTB domain-containing protein n=1 Tax=Fusarium beomiforme TaxID=44412 RepID=A0A9P5DWW3_9HYPO|nr:hypothetical protein FBEOM_8816 [Fusarium beomiforme]
MTTIPPDNTAASDVTQGRNGTAPVSRTPDGSPEPTRAPSSTGWQHRDYNDTIEESTSISIHAALSTLLKSEKFSDMTIFCGERAFKAHRAVVCTQSPFFDKAMSGEFKSLQEPACGEQETGLSPRTEKPEQEDSDEEEPDEEYNEYD